MVDEFYEVEHLGKSTFCPVHALLFDDLAWHLIYASINKHEFLIVRCLL